MIVVLLVLIDAISRLSAFVTEVWAATLGVLVEGER